MSHETNELTNDQLHMYGMHTKHERMPNGELRFRLYSDDGSGYIKTVAGRNGAWQNSHSHRFIAETYVVQSGWMALARDRHGSLCIMIYNAGETVTIDTSIVHNVYLSQGAITHTVKHGTTSDIDWVPQEYFDEETKPLDEEEILERARSSID